MILSRRLFISYSKKTLPRTPMRIQRRAFTPLNTIEEYDDDEEPWQNLEPGTKERMVSKFNSSFYNKPQKIDKEDFQLLILDKWRKRHEVTFYIKNKELYLCILESSAGDQDYIERIADVVEIINEFNLGDKIKRFIRFHPRRYVPANGIEIPLGIYYTGDKYKDLINE
jgi:hypothetical protein